MTEVVEVTAGAPAVDVDSNEVDQLSNRAATLKLSPGVAGTVGRKDLEELRQGLVGGAKPVNVKIPETGKLLLLAGALPPAAPRVQLEMKKE